MIVDALRTANESNAMMAVTVAAVALAQMPGITLRRPAIQPETSWRQTLLPRSTDELAGLALPWVPGVAGRLWNVA